MRVSNKETRALIRHPFNRVAKMSRKTRGDPTISLANITLNAELHSMNFTCRVVIIQVQTSKRRLHSKNSKPLVVLKAAKMIACAYRQNRLNAIHKEDHIIKNLHSSAPSVVFSNGMGVFP